ncbi:hypothetical protein RA086_02325 [Lactiplantibacillus sp. WILCCON 0030]|uniref:Uncharacterized protein n=1 Tax=Lactiplantibacillus brownii TaxID=3069269 RepID=A0ABU1A6G8_9LACO|nr:hypothetical protein [Lactiplantibacillus brownii]MDQ7936481.1 hypothetical protein [Lactiplantibacillus brownii]
MIDEIDLKNWDARGLTILSLNIRQRGRLSMGIVDSYHRGKLDDYTQAAVNKITGQDVSIDDYSMLNLIYCRLGNQAQVVDETGLLVESDMVYIDQHPFQVGIQTHVRQKYGSSLVVEQHEFNTFVISSLLNQQDFKDFVAQVMAGKI